MSVAVYSGDSHPGSGAAQPRSARQLEVAYFRSAHRPLLDNWRRRGFGFRWKAPRDRRRIAGLRAASISPTASPLRSCSLGRPIRCLFRSTPRRAISTSRIGTTTRSGWCVIMPVTRPRCCSPTIAPVSHHQSAFEFRPMDGDCWLPTRAAGASTLSILRRALRSRTWIWTSRRDRMEALGSGAVVALEFRRTPTGPLYVLDGAGDPAVYFVPAGGGQ